MKWTLETKNLHELSPWEKNPRKLTKKQALDLATSIDKFGLCQPLVINQDGTIIGGHQRYETLKRFNVETIAVYIPDRQLTQEECAELALRLNKNTGSWDYDLLANEFDIENLLEFGWDLEELEIEEKKEKSKKCILTLNFSSKEDLLSAENEIAPLIEKYEGAFFKSKF